MEIYQNAPLNERKLNKYVDFHLHSIFLISMNIVI
jgi:hypothetical protein